MELEHGVSGFHSLVGIGLDLKQVLGPRRQACSQHRQQCSQRP